MKAGEKLYHMRVDNYSKNVIEVMSNNFTKAKNRNNEAEEQKEAEEHEVIDKVDIDPSETLAQPEKIKTKELEKGELNEPIYAKIEKIFMSSGYNSYLTNSVDITDNFRYCLGYEDEYDDEDYEHDEQADDEFRMDYEEELQDFKNRSDQAVVCEGLSWFREEFKDEPFAENLYQAPTQFSLKSELDEEIKDMATKTAKKMFEETADDLLSQVERTRMGIAFPEEQYDDLQEPGDMDDDFGVPMDFPAESFMEDDPSFMEEQIHRKLTGTVDFDFWEHIDPQTWQLSRLIRKEQSKGRETVEAVQEAERENECQRQEKSD